MDINATLKNWKGLTSIRIPRKPILDWNELDFSPCPMLKDVVVCGSYDYLFDLNFSKKDYTPLDTKVTGKYRF